MLPVMDDCYKKKKKKVRLGILMASVANNYADVVLGCERQGGGHVGGA